MPTELHTQSASPLMPHAFPGRLIAAEGLDGSGKSTQLQLLHFWLQAEGYEVQIVEWTSSKLIKRALKQGRRQDRTEPMLLSMLHAADLAELHERDLTITKHTLFSRRTERLYHRLRFGDMLKARQGSESAGLPDLAEGSAVATSDGKAEQAGRSKKKSKGKK